MAMTSADALLRPDSCRLASSPKKSRHPGRSAAESRGPLPTPSPSSHAACSAEESRAALPVPAEHQPFNGGSSRRTLRRLCGRETKVPVNRDRWLLPSAWSPALRCAPAGVVWCGELERQALYLRHAVRRHSHRPRPARPLRRLVRGAGVGAAPAPARHAGRGARRRPCAADRADRRRQDPVGLPAQPGRAGGRGGRRADRRARVRPAHALRLPAQGARRRYCAQPRRADRRDGPAGPLRDPHRRHPGPQAQAAAGEAAAHPDDHARIAVAAALLRRRAAAVRRAALRRGRRAPRDGAGQARRPARPRRWRGSRRSRRRRGGSACRRPSTTRTASAAGSRPAPIRRGCGWCARPTGPSRTFPSSSRPCGSRGRATWASTPSPTSTTRSAPTGPRWSSSTPGPRPS